MNPTESLIGMIEDFARVRDFLDAVCCSIENGTQLPNFIPVCNDALITDELGKICEELKRRGV